jgi:hypothetical protein
LCNARNALNILTVFKTLEGVFKELQSGSREMLQKKSVERIMSYLSVYRSQGMIVLQWIPLFSSLCLGVGFIIVAYHFAAVIA